MSKILNDWRNSKKPSGDPASAAATGAFGVSAAVSSLDVPAPTSEAVGVPTESVGIVPEKPPPVSSITPDPACSEPAEGAEPAGGDASARVVNWRSTDTVGGDARETK